MKKCSSRFRIRVDGGESAVTASIVWAMGRVHEKIVGALNAYCTHVLCIAFLLICHKTSFRTRSNDFISYSALGQQCNLLFVWNFHFLQATHKSNSIVLGSTGSCLSRVTGSLAQILAAPANCQDFVVAHDATHTRTLLFRSCTFGTQ